MEIKRKKGYKLIKEGGKGRKNIEDRIRKRILMKKLNGRRRKWEKMEEKEKKEKLMRRRWWRRRWRRGDLDEGGG